MGDAISWVFCLSPLPEATLEVARRVSVTVAEQQGVEDVDGIMDLFLRIYCNVISFDDGGMGIYQDGAAINHDCDPNCTYFAGLDGMGLVVRTLCDIEPGEELTVGYVPLQSLRKKRSYQLLRNFGFTCACTRCVMEESAGDPDEEGEIAMERFLESLPSMISGNIMSEDPSPLADYIKEAKSMMPPLSACGSIFLVTAAKEFHRAHKLNEAAYLYFHVVSRARKLPYRFLLHHRAMVGLTLVEVLLDLSTAPGTTADESGVFLGRAVREAQQSVDAMQLCRGEENMVQAHSLLAKAKASQQAVKNARIMAQFA